MFNDNSALLPYRYTFIRNSTERPSTITSKWYQHIINQTTHQNSLRIIDKYVPRQLISETASYSLTTVPVPERNIRAAFWCASWNDTDNSPILGKAIYTDQASFRF